MVITLLACVYISMVCWAWGSILSYLIQKWSGNKIDHLFSITCLSGLCVIMMLSGILSLFLPLGSIHIQLVFLLPALFVIIRFYKKELISSIQQALSLRTATLFLLLAALLVIILMSSWKIIHPDSLGYHAQLIQWAEKYRAIPGIVNLNARYGLQSNWFLANALFRFKFLGSPALLYLHVTVLSWFIIFIVQQINFYLSQRKNYLNPEVFLWILLIGFNFWSYTQIRLMATSASPDFFAVILTWASLYFLCSLKQSDDPLNHPNIYYVVIFCAAAVTVKLFALPLLLVIGALVLSLLRQKKIRTAAIYSGITILTLLPFLIRNVITSGYPLFPSVYGNLELDWRLNEATTRQIAGYVTAYSRTAVSYSNPEVETILKMKCSEWIPLWWKILSVADKTILSLLLLSIIAALFNAKKLLRMALPTRLAFVVCMTGLVFWFYLAPDPRFGFGYIVSFAALTAGFLLKQKTFQLLGKVRKVATASVLLLGMLLSVYAVYRFQRFYTPGQWLSPLGMEKVPYKTVRCDEISLQVQASTLGCGDTEIPCSFDSCTRFSPRGSRITDGFRSK